MKRCSRNNQKLIYWLITDYAKHQTGLAKPNEYHIYKAKQELKRLYLKHIEYDLYKKNPFENIAEKIDKILDTDASNETKRDEILEELRQGLQALAIQLDGTFSLALYLLSQEEATRFTNFLFDFFIDNNIEMRKELVELYKADREQRYIYTLTKHRKCIICGKDADIHHIDAIGMGRDRRKVDDSYYRKIALCREHHTEIHKIGVDLFKRKYKLETI